MKGDHVRRQLLRDFARAAKVAKESGELDLWRIAAAEWGRLATPAERKKAPEFLGLH